MKIRIHAVDLIALFIAMSALDVFSTLGVLHPFFALGVPPEHVAKCEANPLVSASICSFGEKGILIAWLPILFITTGAILLIASDVGESIINKLIQAVPILGRFRDRKKSMRALAIFPCFVALSAAVHNVTGILSVSVINQLWTVALASLVIALAFVGSPFQIDGGDVPRRVMVRCVALVLAGLALGAILFWVMIC